MRYKTSEADLMEVRSETSKVNKPTRRVTLGTIKTWSSEEERRVDALALRAEERRDKLRKAMGSCK